MLAFVVAATLLASDDLIPPRILGEIVVTAAREEQPRDQAAAAVTLLKRDDLARLPATSLADVLGFVPGVTMMHGGSVPMITSRGFFGGGEVEYVKLLVDGVPLGDAESGNVEWEAVRLADVDHLEVLHGPGSSLYGDTALGGVVQVFTRRDASAGGDVRAAVGSFGARELGARYSDAHLGVYGSSADEDGFREHAQTTHRELALSWAQNGWRADATALRSHRDDPGPLTREEVADDREQSNALFHNDGDTTDRARVSVAYDWFGAAAVHVAAYGIHRDSDTTRTLLLAPGFGSTAVRALTTRAGGATFEASREMFAGTLRAGGDVERATLRGRYGDDVHESGSRDRVGLFVTGGWSAGARTHLTAGLRRDDIRDDFGAASPHASAWSPRAGINVQLGNDWRVFAQWSHAFKAATLDQLFDPRPYPDGFGGTFTVSNPGLRPQRARNIEAGVARRTPSSEASLVMYRMRVTDEIDFDPQTYSYHNIGSSLHRGLEASVAAFTNRLVSPRVTYAWTRVADEERPHQQLKNIPEHVAQLQLHAGFVDVICRYTSGVTLDDEGAFSLPGISRVDLRVSHDLGALRLTADVRNALDKKASELGFVLLDFAGQPNVFDYPAPGRALRLTATWSF